MNAQQHRHRDDDLDLVYRKARTHYQWASTPVDSSLLQEIFDLAKMAPTSANCSPLRVVFVTSPGAKEKLKPTLDPGNVDKTMSAPTTAIFAYDLEFYEHFPKLFPHANAKAWFKGKDQAVFETAFRNATLQAAYFILAARRLGLQCGPMSGFNREAVDQIFFKDTAIKSNFLCNLGIATDHDTLYPRLPRFDFDEVCKIL